MNISTKLKKELEEQVQDIVNSDMGLNSEQAILLYMLSNDLVDIEMQSMVDNEKYDDILNNFRDLQRNAAEKAFNLIENKLFETEFETTDILLNAAIDNNQINDAKWSDWYDALALIEVYDEKLDVKRMEEFERAFNLIRRYEQKVGTKEANNLATVLQDSHSNVDSKFYKDSLKLNLSTNNTHDLTP